MPLTQYQKQIYKFMLSNQNIRTLINTKEMKCAFFILSYIKKLCLHPYLLAQSDLQKKKDIGIISTEEEEALKL